MKSVFLLLLTITGVAAILYCRVNLNMRWDDMNVGLINLIPRMLSIAVLLAGMVATVFFINRRTND